MDLVAFIFGIATLIGGVVSCFELNKWGKLPSKFLSEIDVNYSVEYVWDAIDDTATWKWWMFGINWKYGEMTSKDPNYNSAVEMNILDNKRYVECLERVPLKKLAIKNHEITLVKLSSEKTRIMYAFTYEHSNLFEKIYWYLTEIWIRKWDLPNNRMLQLKSYLRTRNLKI